MPTFTHTAEDVINAVIQDGQVQTTNRTALLDYVNRTSLRILRESQWSFLQSGYKKFITKAGVEKYWIGSGPTPNGCSNTGLNLTDLESVLPDSVFDLTNARHLGQDSSQVRYTLPYLQRDGTMQAGPPRAFAYYEQEPGVISLFPPPDNQNNYYPIPQPSACSNLTGGVLPGRTYYIQTAFVDSAGGIGVASTIFEQYVPYGSLCVVASPEPEVPSALSPTYAYWNVYVSTANGGPFFQQNALPISIGSPWVESTTGINNEASLTTQVVLASPSGQAYILTVTTEGQLNATPSSLVYSPYPVYMLDPYSNVWSLGVNSSGSLTSVAVPFVQIANSLVLADSAGEAWEVTLNSEQQLVATPIGPASAYNITGVVPVTSPTIVPLQGYVIAFRYQQVKQPILSSTQTLQIPDAYFDVVVAGVNYLANVYTAKGDDEGFKAPLWKKEFMDGLAQIRRDLRINYRNVDFVSPDQVSQANPYKSVWFYVF